MVVASDSHSNLYGAMAALGTPVVRTDAASIWATAVTWWQVPPVAKVTLKGKLHPGVVGKDIIIALCGLFNHDEVLNHAVEFHSPSGGAGVPPVPGEGVACLSMDQRMSIANMTTEWAAAAAVVKGKKVAPGVEFYLAAASAETQAKAQHDGHWKTLLAAGAIELPPGCGTCIGLGAGTIKAGEVGISATNRNFEGRMGDR